MVLEVGNWGSVSENGRKYALRSTEEIEYANNYYTFYGNKSIGICKYRVKKS